ncbi:MAG: lysylphosphatidylglycerol synthase transmembrane domain-containing protein, partial [Candidatus Brocadiia bacterium]|nr:lysylphosphatidylglycerol synthase transmembrane domain-containing protein [Candidatus Brocadiia bacterium]
MEQLAKRRLLLAVGLTVSLVASVWFAVQVRGNWPEVVKTFRGARHLHLHLTPSIGFIALVYAFRVARWRRFLAPIKRVRASSVAAATCIGFTANNLLPLRAGELIRPYVLHRKEGVRFGHCLATAVGLERVFDLIGLMLLILATSLMMPGGLLAASADAQVAEDLGRIRLGIILFGAAAAAGAVGFTALALFPRPFVALGERCTRVLPARWRGPANAFFHSLADAMGFLKDWREVVLAVGFSFGLWLSIGLSTFWLVKGLGLDLGLAGSLFVVVAVGVAVAVPQAPGYVGV